MQAHAVDQRNRGSASAMATTNCSLPNEAHVAAEPVYYAANTLQLNGGDTEKNIVRVQKMKKSWQLIRFVLEMCQSF